nr:hypothetical protein [uncultured Roseateles sp.]
MLEIRLQPMACALPELRATINYLQQLAELRADGVIAPEDRPDVGAASVLTLNTPETWNKTQPGLDLPPDPAAVFGHVPVPAPAVVAPPALPPAIPAPVAPAAASAAPLPPAVAMPPTAATAPTAVPGVEMDSKGLPWDARIHASSKTKNQDGSWRAKRGLNDAALVQRVEAELRAVAAIPSPAPAASIAVSATPLPPPVAPAASAPVPMAPPAAPGIPPAPPVAASDPTDFPSLMKALAPLFAANRLTQQHVNDACAAASGGVISVLPMLVNRPDLVPSVWAHLKQWATA